MDTLILRDDRFLAHDPGPGEPERRERLLAVHASLDAAPFAGTTTATPRRACPTELLTVHTPEHVRTVAATADQPRVTLDYDTHTCPASYEASMLAAGGACQAVEAVVWGQSQGAFVLARPPGHHAEANKAMGFCLFNNAAIAAEHAIRQLDVRRVAVIDPDVHHGNGIQHAFEGRAEVLYVSSHRYPFYPGTGAAHEVGTGRGAGYTLNLPLPAGLGDADFLHLYDALVMPVLRRFAPELIIVSAGFDTWHDDPLGDLAITEAGFRALFARFRAWADAACPGRLVALLEGGYDLAGVVAGVRAGLHAMTAERTPDDDVSGPISDAARRVEAQVRQVHAPFWPDLDA